MRVISYLFLFVGLVGCVTTKYNNGQEVAQTPAPATVAACEFEKLNFDRKAFNQFHGNLLKAINRSPASVKHKNYLINQVTYPLVVNNSKQTKVFQKSTEVKEHYNEIFNSNTIDTIKTQKLSDIKCSLKGISYGDGVVWVGLDENKKYKIYSINHL